MRNGYPISTYDLSDKLMLAYENLVHLLGIQTESGVISGLYDNVDTSGLYFMTNQSGIPHIGSVDGMYQVGLELDTTSLAIIDYLRSDYVLRKYLGVI